MPRRKFIQLGCGGWGTHWVNEVLPRLIHDLGLAEAAAVVDMNPETFPLAMERYGIAREKCYTEMERAFAENRADFAVVVVPPAFHEKAVDLALAHGMDILSEKPIADTMEGAVRIYRKVKRAGRKMAVTMSHRFDQDKQTLEREIKSGRHGRLHYLVGRNTWNCRKFGVWRDFRHKMADPLLIEGTVHHFDIFRALAGSNARTVHAVTWNPPWGEYAGDSTALVTLEMENGVKVFYEGAKANASTLNNWHQDYLRAECEAATLELDRRRLRSLKSQGWEPPAAEEIPLLEQAAWKNAWLAELFARWLDGGPPPPTTLDDNLQCAALLFAAVESAHEKKPVDVQKFLARHLGPETEGSSLR